MNRILLGCAVLAAVSAVVFSESANCTAACKDYSTCSSLVNTTNHTAFLNNSLLCSANNDNMLGLLFNKLDACKLKEAAIEVADLIDIQWDGVSAVEALIEDIDFWKPTCEWDHMAAAACVYFSLPDDKTCINKPFAIKSKMFCKGECMKIANSCLNLGKYKQLNDSVTSFCNDLTDMTEKPTDNCFKAQFDQSGLKQPDCKDNTVKAKSLTGPYIVGIVALALSVVALIGLALITCKNSNNAGAPNSF